MSEIIFHLNCKSNYMQYGIWRTIIEKGVNRTYLLGKSLQQRLRSKSNIIFKDPEAKKQSKSTEVEVSLQFANQINQIIIEIGNWKCSQKALQLFFQLNIN